MKKCAGCGAEFDDTSRYCPFCGTEYGAEESTEAAAENTGFYPERGRKVSQNTVNNYGMTWHKILMFLLILHGLRSILSGLGDLLFSREEWKVYYTLIPGLRAYVVMAGVSSIAIGVFAMIVFSRLRKLKRNGPASLKMLYLISIGVTVLMDFWSASIIPGAEMLKGNVVISVLENVIMLAINNVYYGRREELFVN